MHFYSYSNYVIKKPSLRRNWVLGLSTDNRATGVNRAGNISAVYASTSVDVTTDVATGYATAGVNLIEYTAVNGYGATGIQDTANIAFYFDAVAAIYLKRVAAILNDDIDLLEVFIIGVALAINENIAVDYADLTVGNTNTSPVNCNFIHSYPLSEQSNQFT